MNAKQVEKPPGWLYRLRTGLGWNPNAPSSESNDVQGKAKGRPGKKPVVISDAFKEESWDLSEKLSIIPYFGRTGEVFEGRGFADGAMGIDGTAYYHLAKTKVKGLVDDLRALFDGEEKRLSTLLTGLETIANDAEKDYEHTNRILLRKSYHPRHFSLLLAAIYMVVAIFLVLADIPLAVSLIETGFNLNIGSPDLTELMRQPWEVVAGNWETLVMAFGIALCSIFFKVLYDEYVSGPLSSRATLYRREPELDQQSDGERRSVLRAFRFRAGVKLLILALTLGTIIVLGFFRFQTIAAVQPQAPYLSSFTTKLTFILITLLFPIVSGVCFSMSLDRFLNLAEFIGAKRKIEKCQKKYIESTERFVESTAKHDKIGVYKDWVCTDEFFLKYLNFLLACYVIGYERGQMAPESRMNKHGYYEMVSKMRRKIVSRQVFNSIKDANQSDKESILAQFEKMVQEDFKSEDIQFDQSHEKI